MSMEIFSEYKSYSMPHVSVTAYFSATLQKSETSDFRYIVYETWLRYPEHLDEHFCSLQKEIVATYEGTWKNTSALVREAIFQADRFFALIADRVTNVNDALQVEQERTQQAQSTELELPF